MKSLYKTYLQRLQTSESHCSAITTKFGCT